MKKELTDEQVKKRCIRIAKINGFKASDCGCLACDNYIYPLLYNTSNGFAKALFGEEDKVDCPEGRRMGWRWHLSEMVGKNPIDYLRNWLKQRGSK